MSNIPFFEKLNQFLQKEGMVFKNKEEAIQYFMKQEAMDNVVMFPNLYQSRNNELAQKIKNLEDRAGQLGIVAFIQALADLEKDYMYLVDEEKQDAGEIYSDYLLLNYMLGDLHFDNNLLVQAEYYLNNSIYLDEHDSYGARYKLMAIAARRGETFTMMYLMKRYGLDDMTLLFFTITALVTGNLEEASRHFRQLLRVNKQAKSVFQHGLNYEEIIDAKLLTEYSPSSKESLLIALSDVIVVMSEFMEEWMIQEVKKWVINKGTEGEYFDRFKFDLRDVITTKAYWALQQEGLISREALSEKTEKELLALSGIGPKTIQNIKELGITFKEVIK